MDFRLGSGDSILELGSADLGRGHGDGAIPPPAEQGRLAPSRVMWSREKKCPSVAAGRQGAMPGDPDGEVLQSAPCR